MPSQVPGFEYDIFVSYRHNDNKAIAGREGWVTEFVENLQGELESTVKGSVGIYFDKNPHDGLLETHDVDESLAVKLNSVIFIAVISQTYCDPESFAWRHEFQAFKRISASDKFGPSVKLLNGNVSSRVLPIRIHELDKSDVTLLENELNGKIRSIDFIFKTPGVNRPLRPDEDNPLKNANHTHYRDQVNKTANAIKEIIHGLKSTEKQTPHKAESSSPVQVPILEKKAPAKSLAVLPFVNLTIDPEFQYIGDGLADEIIKSLAVVRDLKVPDRSASFQHRDSKRSIQEIGQLLSVSAVVKGTIQTRGDRVKVTASLMNTGNGAKIWSGELDRGTDELMDLSREIVKNVLEKFSAIVRDGERKQLEKQSTTNGKAYLRYLKGRHLLNQSGEAVTKCIAHFGEAAALDPDFAHAHAALASAYVLMGHNEMHPLEDSMKKSKEAALRALAIDPTVMEAYLALAFVSMGYEWNWPEAEGLFNKVFSINPYNTSAPERYAFYLGQIINNFKEAEAEPIVNAPHFLHAYALLHRGKFEDALQAATNAVELDPNSFMAHRAVGLSYLGMEKYDSAIESLLTAARLSNRHQWLLFELMGAYTLSGRNEEAQTIIEEALASSNTLPAKIFNFFFSSKA